MALRWRGLDEAIRRNVGLRRRRRNVIPAWRQIDKSMTLVERRQFASRGAFGGVRWAPLRPATRRARPRPGGNRGGVDFPLWDTGAVKQAAEGEGPNVIRVFRPRLYQRGIRLFRAALHQIGYTVRQWGGRRFKRPRRVVPRQIFPDPMPVAVRRTWVKFMSRWLLDGK